MANFTDRVGRLQEAMRASGIGLAVLAPGAQMRYLSGWAEPGHERLLALFVPASGEPAFVVPALNAAQAAANPAAIRDLRSWDDAAGWEGVVSALVNARVRERAFAIDDELQSGHLLALQRLFPGARWEPGSALMARLREVKESDELAALQRSAAITDAVYEECVRLLREGMTELEMVALLADAYERRGARADFAIVGFGPNSALPHHSPGDAALADGDVAVIDIGCSVDGYASDITRTVAFGTPPPEAGEVYRVVLRAHQAAQGVARPGATCESVDRAARDVIESAGYGERFIHRTGHGIGLSGHEPPYIVAGNTQALRPGMCFSDEPGIYLPGRFGVRIENILTITPDGASSLNAAPPADLPAIRPAP
ncbi:MAG: aminopeptidase P family protein [Chthonomonadales bacterium]|nr:aminopeptidase P family protein [Chthonomonadales bacterium]